MVDPITDVIAIVDRTVDITAATRLRIADAQESFRRDAERARSIRASLRTSWKILQSQPGFTMDGTRVGSASLGTGARASGPRR